MSHPRGTQPSDPRSRSGRAGSTTSSTSAGASSATAVPSSLFSTLTKPAVEGYPATEVIKYLIEVVGRDVVSFRRNAQVSFLLVDRARDICDAINIHIKKTESGNDWSSFEKFSDAIDPVEDALFKLVSFTEDEKTHHLVEGNSVQDWITFAENWVTNRKEIWSTLNLLETRRELTNLFSGVNVSSRQTEREEARNHDDKTFFGEVIEEMDGTLSSLPKVPQAARATAAILRELLNKVSTGAIPPDLTVFALKTGLLVQGVVKLIFQTPSADPATVAHLKSAPVWGVANQLVELLNSTRDDGTESMDRVRVKYEEFSRILHVRQISPVDVPKSYLELLKLAGQVRRPFHSQAIALISLCRTLVTEFEKDAHRTSDNLDALEKALNVTLQSLQEAVAAVTELRMFDLDNFEAHPAYKALARAQRYIKTCHDTFGLGGWNQKELLIAEAVRKDKERMDRFNKLLETRPPLTARERAEQIELTVVVCERSTSKLIHQTTFFVEESTRLGAVRWTVAGSLEEPHRNRARQSGSFLLLPGGTTCELHESISELAGSKKKCTLRFLV